jgi:DHA2 family metal-tetracycline-proton antiporter-like MFS transporter
MELSSRKIGVVFGALCVLPAAGLGAPAVALPALRADLGTTIGASSWVLASYSLAASVGMVLTGRIMERRGSRPIVIVSSVLLIAGAVLALFAPSLAIVVAARLLLGLAAAGLLTTAYASVGVLEGGDRAKALATISAAVGIGSACGPLIGGLLVAGLGWRAVIISPVASVLLVPVALRLLPAKRPEAQPRLDWLGAALLTVLGSATVGLLESKATDLSGTVVIVLAAIAILALVGLVVETRRAARPFVPPRVLQVPGFVAACFAGAASYAGYFALLFAAPLLLETDGYKSAIIGLLLLPAVIGSVVASRFGRMAGHRIGVPWTVAVLGVITLGAVLLAALTDGATIAVVLAVMIGIAGFAGAQVVFVAAITQSVEAQDANVATGLYNFVAFIGGALGPACVGAFAVSMPLHSALAAAAVLPLIATLLALLVVVRRHQAGVVMMRI